MRGHRTALALLCVAACAALPGAASAQRQPLDIRVFARVGQPGQPEGIAVVRDGTVYVGTNQQERGDSDAPSRIFAYSPQGVLLRDYLIQGQNLNEPHGIQYISIDADGLLYALDRAEDPRVVTIDPRTGEQRDYARLRDVPSCMAAGRTSDCSATFSDSTSEPNTSTFAADGSLYVTDIEQALIWRVPPGGGTSEVFFTDQRLESPFGPNGIQMMADGRTLMFVVSGQPPGAGTPTAGRLWKLPVRAGPRPGELQHFWEGQPLEGPDGFALARSGNVYLALAGANQLVLISPSGQEVARVPDPVRNAQMDPPFDSPASVAFLGESALVTNQSFVAGNPDHWAVFDVFAGEPGQRLFRPDIAQLSTRLSLRLRYARGRDAAGRRCARRRVRATLRGADQGRVREATFHRDGRQVARDESAPFSAIVYRPRPAGSRVRTVVARAELDGGGTASRRARVRTCAAAGPRFTG